MIEDLLKYWPIVVLLGNALAVWILWSMRRAFASKEEVSKLRDDHDTLRAEVEGKFANLPNKDSVHELELVTTKLTGRIDVLVARMDGDRALFERVERQLQLVVKGHLRTDI